MEKRGAILIVLVEGYSILMYLFGSFLLFCRFSCLLFFLGNKFTLVVPQTFSWVFAMKSQTDTLQDASVLYMESCEAIVIFRAILIASSFS